MNKIVRFFIFWVQVFLLIIALGILFNGLLLKTALSSSLGLYWDTDISIQKAQIDLSLPGIILEKLKVGNPYGFPRGDMLEIERVDMRFDRSRGFFSEGDLKPVLLDIQINKIALMRRVSGHLNFHLLVQPEDARKKNRGLGLSPVETRISVNEVVETDATSPLLKKKKYDFQNKEFSVGEKSNFRVVAQIFARELFQRIGLNEEGNAPLLPAPQYHGIASSVEEEIREHADNEARREAAEAEFEVLSKAAETNPNSATH